VAGSPRVSRRTADLESASPARELVIAARLLLFGEAVGFAVALAETGATIAWLGKLGRLWVAILLLFAGAALGVAFQPGLYRPNRGTRWFLAINACTGLLLVSEGLGQRDPDPALLTLGAAAFAAAILVPIYRLSVGIVVGRLSLAAVVLGMGYACTFWLPSAEPAALILHIKGVLIAPIRTTSVLQLPGGRDISDRLVENDARSAPTHHLAGTVDPGNYRVGVDCSVPGDIKEHVIWTTVHVSIGAIVTVANVCPDAP
jgi:hypothetical protein